MGRYGRSHHRNFDHRPERKHYEVSEDFDSSDDKHRSTSGVKQDWDSSRPEKPQRVTEDWNSDDVRPKSSIVDKLKNRYAKYTSPEARNERRVKKLERRSRNIQDLEYRAKKAKLESTIRKSNQTAPSTVFGPKSKTNMNLYSGMDRMFGFGSGYSSNTVKKPKQKQNQWGGMDRMLGFGSR